MKGLKPPQVYSPHDFFPEEFDKVVELIRESETWCKEDNGKLYAKFSPSVLDGALHAVDSLNGSSTAVDWPALLRQSASVYEIADDMVKTGKRAQKTGELPDVLPLATKLRSFAVGEKPGLRMSKDVDWQSAKGLQKSGWDAIDLTIGGIAESGPVVICAPTKTGKSFFTAQLVNKFLNFYTDRRAAIFPLELTDKRYLKRSFEMYPTLLKPHEEGRIFTSSKTRTIEGIASDVSTMGDCGIIVIDGIDGLVKGSYETSKFAGAWSGVIELGVVLDVPVVVTTQPNREGKWSATREFLSPYAIEWSGAAENGAEQLWMLQYIQYGSDFEDERFPVHDDSYYLISWLQREGWRNAQEGPGAVIFKKPVHNKEGHRILWEGNPEGTENTVTGKWMPKLWRPGAAKMKIGKTSSRKKTEED